jgi:TolB-like protein
MSNFFNELKNRNVYKAATAYVVTGWLIMQVVDTMSNNLEWPPAIASWITKILIVGFPITLVITWLYEVTPAGLKRTGKVQEDTPENRRSGKRLNHLIIGVLAIAICFMLVERVFFAGNVSINKRQEASIAVLPFENLSPDNDYAFLANSLPAQLIEELAHISGLQVTNRTSSFAVKKQGEDVKEMAKALDVNYLLDGDLQYDPGTNRIRISTHLINAGNRYIIWAGTFEDDFDKIQEMQENINRKVASQLRVQLLPEEDKALSRKIAENSEAYRLYMEAREYGHKRTDPDLAKAIELANKALELEPDFAEAHAALSTFYGLRSAYGNLSKKERDHFQELHLSKALEIAPNLPEVLHAKASRNMWILGDTTDVIKDMEQVIEQKPGFVEAHYALFNALAWRGDLEGARNSLEKVLQLDPGNNFYNAMLAKRLFWVYHEHDKAIALIDRQLLINPEAPNANRLALFKAIFLMNQPYGDLVEAFKIRHKEYKKDPSERWNLNHGLLGALELDLFPWSEKLARTIQLRYSDSWAIYNNMAAIYSFKRDFNAYDELIKYAIQEDELNGNDKFLESSWVQMRLGNPEEALAIFEEGFPNYANETILKQELSYPEEGPVSLYIELLRASGLEEKANTFSKKLCNYFKSEIDNNPNLDNHTRNNYMLTCAYSSGEANTFVKELHTIYFEKKDRQGWYSEMKSGYFFLFENDLEYQKLFSKIEAEVHRQRAEVIEYLKEEGDWDPAWDAELGLE